MPRGAVTPLTPELLLRAYAIGVFPMAEGRDDPRIVFIEPDRRGILPLDGFHLPRSLAKTIRRGRFEIRVDTAFAEVLQGCAALAPPSWSRAPAASSAKRWRCAWP